MTGNDDKIIYEIDGKKIKIREKLYARDWQIYQTGMKIIGDIRQKRTNIDVEKEEIKIDTGDFTREQFIEFAACGFIDEAGENISAEICNKLPLEISLKGFAFFYLL